MLFGLFFGAGNLIFPVQMGREAGSHTTFATIGFLITATGLPVLGVIASALSGTRNVRELAARVDPRFAVVFTCLLYLTIGPAFAIPRTASVSYEIGLAESVPVGAQTWALLAFTAIFFALTAAAALRPGKLIDWVGRYLTPGFLVLLGALIVAAFVKPMTHDVTAAPKGPYADGPVTRGFLDGYNTMDALASLAFSIVIIDAVRRLGITSPRRIAVETAKSGIVSVLGMAAIYASLAWMGATSIGVITADNGGTALAGISRHSFGSFGQVLIAAIVLVACLKTSIGLVTACAEMFAEMFPRLGYRAWALTFTGVSLAVSNIGLSAIISWSTPLLMFLYPLAIALILLGLASPWLKGRGSILVGVVACVGVAALFDLLAALPSAPAGRDALVDGARTVLPWFENGFGWVVPGLLGLVGGAIVSRVRHEG